MIHLIRRAKEADMIIRIMRMMTLRMMLVREVEVPQDKKMLTKKRSGLV